MAPNHTDSTPARDPEIHFWADRNFELCQREHRRQHALAQRRKVQRCVEAFAARSASVTQQTRQITTGTNERPEGVSCSWSALGATVLCTGIAVALPCSAHSSSLSFAQQAAQPVQVDLEARFTAIPHQLPAIGQPGQDAVDQGVVLDATIAQQGQLVLDEQTAHESEATGDGGRDLRQPLEELNKRVKALEHLTASLAAFVTCFILGIGWAVLRAMAGLLADAWYWAGEHVRRTAALAAKLCRKARQGDAA